MPALNFWNLTAAIVAAAVFHLGGLAGLAYLILPQGARVEQTLKVSLAPPVPPATAAPRPPESRQETVTLPVRMDGPRLVEESKVPDKKALEALTSPHFGPSTGGVIGGMAGSALSGVLADLVQSIPKVAPPPPPPPQAPPAPEVPQQVQIPGAVHKARLIKEVLPDYPPIARQSRIQGLVRLDVLIKVDGSVGRVTLVSGHPLLAPAAIQAVRHWVFQPTTLKGKPVEVRSFIDVNFRLEGI